MAAIRPAMYPKEARTVMGGQTVLIVTDQPNARDLFAHFLQPHFAVVNADDSVSAIKRLSCDKPDAALVGPMTPVRDGWTLVERIRECSAVPIILVTAQGSVADRIQGLALGADDCLSMPLDGLELVARVGALVRRVAFRDRPPSVVRRGELELYLTDRRALLGGRPLPLSPTEFELLTVLASHPGLVFPRQRLLGLLHGVSPDSHCRTLDSHVKNIRVKLGDGAGMIETVWGLGYRFVEPPGRDHSSET